MSSEILEQAAFVFSEANSGVLKCKAVKATYSMGISLHHDILRYIFNCHGKSSADRMCMLYEESDFKKLCLPHYWHYYTFCCSLPEDMLSFILKVISIT